MLRVHDVFHLDLLSPYRETAQYGLAFTPPPPDLIDRHEEQEIEAILNMHTKQGGKATQYSVATAWLGLAWLGLAWLSMA